MSTDPLTALTALITEHSGLTGVRADRLARRITAEWAPAQVAAEREWLYAQIKDVIEQVADAPGINDSARSGVALALAALRSRKSLEALAVADDLRAANGGTGSMVDRAALVEKLTHLLGTDDATKYYDAPASRRLAAERYANTLLASGVITDAADVRRQTAEDVLRRVLHDLDGEPVSKADVDGNAGTYMQAVFGGDTNRDEDWQAAYAFAREVGGDRG